MHVHASDLARVDACVLPETTLAQNANPPNDTDQTFAVVWLIAECGESLSESLGGAIDEDSCLTELQTRVTLASQLSKLLRAGSAYDGS